MKATRLYDYTTIRQFADFVTQERLRVQSKVSDVAQTIDELPKESIGSVSGFEWEEPGTSESDPLPRRSTDVAIIGIAARLPGAKDVDEFWQNLKDGRISIREIPEERWRISDYYDPDPSVPGKTYCKMGHSHGC